MKNKKNNTTERHANHELQSKDTEDARNELLLHMAKIFIENSINFHESIFHSISAVLIIAIPGYIGLLGILRNEISLSPYWVRFMPILFWIISLIICIIILFRKVDPLNLWNYQSVVDIYVKALKVKRRLGFWAFFSLVVGLILSVVAIASVGI